MTSSFDEFDPLALPRVLSRSDALSRGFTRREIEVRLKSGRWRRVLPRTYLTSDTLTWPDRAIASLLFAGPESALTGAAALADRGLRCVARPDQIMVLVPMSCGVASAKWVRVRRTPRMSELEPISGPRRAIAARAVADLARELRGLDDVRTLVTQALRRSLCTIDELMVELHEGSRNGRSALRTAIEDAAGGAWSAPEGRAGRLLRAAHVPSFEQNVAIMLDGRMVVVDFLWRALRAVLEIDSVEHHLDPADWRRTQDRHLLLTQHGYSVVHRTPRDVVARPQRFVADIERWLVARSAELA